MSEFSTIFEERKTLVGKLHVSLENKAKHIAFLDFLWKKNQEDLNIVSRKMTKKELFDKHFLDSFLALPFWPKDKLKVADLGSGGGFPAVPLAIEMPGQDFFLYEKSPKKQAYLKDLIHHLELKNVYVCQEVKEPLNVDLIVAKAFKSLQGILHLTKEHYKNDGNYFLYKGRKDKVLDEIKHAKKQWPDLKARIEKLATYDLDIEERNLILI